MWGGGGGLPIRILKFVLYRYVDGWGGGAGSHTHIRAVRVGGGGGCPNVCHCSLNGGGGGGCLLMGTPNSVIQPLQKGVNLAPRLALLAPRHHHSTPLLEKNCTGFPLSCMYVFQRYKCSELPDVYTPSHTLRSSSDTRILKIQQYKRKTRGFRTFSGSGPNIWNSLPQDFRHCSTLSSFKAKLKTFFFSQYFHSN